MIVNVSKIDVFQIKCQIGQIKRFDTSSIFLLKHQYQLQWHQIGYLKNNLDRVDRKETQCTLLHSLGPYNNQLYYKGHFSIGIRDI